MTDKEQTIIDGINLSDIRSRLEHGQRMSISTKEFEQIIDLLEEKMQECEELKKYIQEREVWGDHCEFCKHNDKENCHQNIILDNLKTINCYRKALEEIEQELKENIYCESQECGCDDSEECLRCTKSLILDIINKAKGEGEC